MGRRLLIEWVAPGEGARRPGGGRPRGVRVLAQLEYRSRMPLRSLKLDELTIDDEASFRQVAIYQRLKDVLRRAGHKFQVAETGENKSWDRVVFLNLTFWSSSDESSVLCDEHIAPDVVAHTALHHVVGRELGRVSEVGAPSPAALLFAEAIASAFDLYLVGRLVDNAPDSDFVTSQLPVMAEAAEQAGLDEPAFARLIDGVRAAPERAFEDMRALLVDAGTALLTCADAGAAHAVLERFAGARFAPLLHHFQLSNWILYTRAYARGQAPGAHDAGDQAIAAFDRTLRESGDSLAWLDEHWLAA
jgi:hypothetical protein